MKVLLTFDHKQVHADEWVNALSRKGIEVSTAYSHQELTTSTIREQDLIHFHYLRWASLRKILLSKIFGKKTLVSVWGSDIICFPSYGFEERNYLRTCVFFANAVIATTHFLAEETRKRMFFPLSDKLYVIPFGVRLDLFDPRKVDSPVRDQLGDPKIVVGVVKRLIPYYGIRYFVRAASIVLKKNPDTMFLIVGGGPEMEELKKLSKDLGVHSHVHFAGAITHEEVPKYLKAMDVFVMPSLREGFGVSALEAMAMKVPVVATNVGGVPEIIENGKNGLLVDPENEDQLAAAVVRLLEDGGLRERIVEVAEKSVQRYSWDRVIEKMIRIYNDIMTI